MMINKIASFFPEDPTFTLVDFRDSVTVSQVYRRVWASDGLASVAVPTIHSTLHGIVEHAVALGAPIAYVVREGTLDKEEIIFAFAQKCALLVQEHLMFEEVQGELCYQGEPLPPLPPTPNRTVLTVEGAFRHDFPAVTFPKALEIECSGQGVRGCYLRISAKPAGQVPEDAWYYLAGPERGTLEISILPRRESRDTWQVRYAGRPVAQVSPPAQAPISGKLAVVLDRTCPDRAHWRRARDLSLGTVSTPKDTVNAKMGFGGEEGAAGAAEGALSYPAFNMEIRNAIGPGLVAALGDRNVSVHAAWFADIGCEGLEMPEGVQPPEKAYSSSGQSDAGGAHHLFSALTYSPGIDLWDAAEQGLKIGIQAIQDDPAGVIIIGNSPPAFPTQRSPLRNLNRVEVGRKDVLPTAVRDSNPEWYDQLKRGKELGIPVVYLFLTHDHLPDVESLSEIERSHYLAYLNMQSRLLEALKACNGLQVIAVKADAAGVHTALKEAVTWMESPTARLNLARILP